MIKCEYCPRVNEPQTNCVSCGAQLPLDALFRPMFVYDPAYFDGKPNTRGTIIKLNAPPDARLSDIFQQVSFPDAPDITKMKVLY